MVIISGPMGSPISSVYYAILEFVKGKYRNPFSIESNCLFTLNNIIQVELSRIEETTLSEQVTLALKDSADFLAVNPIRDRSSAEILFLHLQKLKRLMFFIKKAAFRL